MVNPLSWENSKNRLFKMRNFSYCNRLMVNSLHSFCKIKKYWKVEVKILSVTGHSVSESLLWSAKLPVLFLGRMHQIFCRLKKLFLHQGARLELQTWKYFVRRVAINFRVNGIKVHYFPSHSFKIKLIWIPSSSIKVWGPKVWSPWPPFSPLKILLFEDTWKHAEIF